MKHVILFLLLLLMIVQSLNSQKRNDTAKPNYKSSHRETEKPDFFDFNFLVGADNNRELMAGIGICYKHKYKFLGFGLNADLIFMKNFFEEDDDDSVTVIHHHNYSVSGFENRNALAVDLFGSLNAGGVFFNSGITFVMLLKNNYYISNVTGEKWKGDVSTGTYYGLLTQLQIYIPQTPHNGITVTAEVRFMKDLKNLYAMKIGMWF